MLVRLEMDEKRMSIASFAALPAWVVSLGLSAHLGGGFALGILYFRSLWWSVNRFGGRGSLAGTVALMIGRFVLIGGVLTLASLEGALPLLATALGVLIARSAVVSRVGEIAP
jgi:F1F0 ATPase subunit 2